MHGKIKNVQSPGEAWGQNSANKQKKGKGGGAQKGATNQTKGKGKGKRGAWQRAWKKAKANAKMNHREAVRINAFWRLLDGCCHADLAWRFDRHDELCQKLYMVDAGMVRRPEVSELPWAVLLTFGPLSKTHFLWQASSSLQAVLAGNKQLWQQAALETCIGRIFKA